MADINSRRSVQTSEPLACAAAASSGADQRRLTEIVELLFFAYRDFTGEPDAILAEYGFGRAHHRVLHFVGRRPGLRVAELLDILKITKQSLARVLKQLVDDGFIEARSGETDRRERRLYPTAKGAAIAARLVGLQVARIAAAIAAAGPAGEEVTRRFLSGMIGDADRNDALQWIENADPAGATGASR